VVVLEAAQRESPPRVERRKAVDTAESIHPRITLPTDPMEQVNPALKNCYPSSFGILLLLRRLTRSIRFVGSFVSAGSFLPKAKCAFVFASCPMKSDSLTRRFPSNCSVPNETTKSSVEVSAHFLPSVENLGECLPVVIHDTIISLFFSTIFPNRQKTRKPNEIVHKKYILSTEQYDFGPLVIGKDINK
jgi:hypothetical protein